MANTLGLSNTVMRLIERRTTEVVECVFVEGGEKNLMHAASSYGERGYWYVIPHTYKGRSGYHLLSLASCKTLDKLSNALFLHWVNRDC